MNTSSPSHKTTAATDADRHLSHTDYIRIATGDPAILQWCDEIDAEIETLKSRLLQPSPTTVTREVQDIVDAQAEDEGLWFHAETCAEAYVQQELRKLHAAIERNPPSPAPGAGGVPTLDELARVIEHAMHGVEWTAGKRPSIAELEQILLRDDEPNIFILPDGSITAGEPREAATKCAATILKLLSPSTGLDGVGVDVEGRPHGLKEGA